MTVVKDACMHMVNVSFQDCALVIVAGASVTLVDTNFTWSHDAKDSISILAIGRKTHVSLQRCIIQGGYQGVTVRGGATVHAVALECRGVARMGLESHGRGSKLRLEDCAVVEMCTCSGQTSTGDPGQSNACSCSELYRTDCVGIKIHGSSAVRGERVLVEDAGIGLVVEDSHANLENSTVQHCSHTCCEVGSLYSTEFVHCVFDRAMHSGLSFIEHRPHHQLGETLAQHVVRNCRFQECQQGVIVRGPVFVAVDSCRSVGNDEGFVTAGRGVLCLSDCMSTADRFGLLSQGASLKATDMLIRDSSIVGSAVFIEDSTVELKRCAVLGWGTSLHVRGSTVKLSGCRLRHKKALYDALFNALKLSHGSSVQMEDMDIKCRGCEGLSADGGSTTVELVRCTIDNTKRYSVAVTGRASVVMKECQLVSSTGEGAGCKVTGAGTRLVAHDTVIDGSVGVWCSIRATAELYACHLRTAYWGVFLSGRSEGDLQNCVLETLARSATGAAAPARTTTWGVFCTASVLHMLAVRVVSRGASMSKGYECALGGTVWLQACDTDACAPYSTQSGGEIFCHECVPDDKARPDLPW